MRQLVSVADITYAANRRSALKTRGIAKEMVGEWAAVEIEASPSRPRDRFELRVETEYLDCRPVVGRKNGVGKYADPKLSG